MKKIVLLFLLSLTFLFAQDFQPPINFINYRLNNETVRLCPLNADGTPGNTFYIQGRDIRGNYYNQTVIPTPTQGNYHVLPYELYTCNVIYQGFPTYLVQALGQVVNGKKLMSLVAHGLNVGWPKGIISITIVQLGVRKAHCATNDCGDAGSLSVNLDAFVPIDIYIY